MKWFVWHDWYLDKWATTFNKLHGLVFKFWYYLWNNKNICEEMKWKSVWLQKHTNYSFLRSRSNGSSIWTTVDSFGCETGTLYACSYKIIIPWDVTTKKNKTKRKAFSEDWRRRCTQTIIIQKMLSAVIWPQVCDQWSSLNIANMTTISIMF